MSAMLTSGIPLKPYSGTQRRTYLPLKATSQVYESSFLVQGSGAVCVANTSGDTSTVVVGVSEYDMLGGASNGTARCSSLSGREFIVNPGGNTAPTDATPYGTILYADTDNSVGTVNTGTALPKAGYFTGIEPNGLIRIFVQGW